MPRSVRLTKQPQTVLEDAIIPKSGAAAVTPAQQLYGIYGPQYAALLAQPKKSSAEAAFDKAHLAHMSHEEQTRYDAALAAAQAAQRDIADTEGYYGILGKQEDYVQGDLDRGIAGARGEIRRNPDGHYGIYRSDADNLAIQVGNANSLNNDQADRFGKYAAGTKELADAGYGMSPEDVGKLVTPPTQATPQQYGVYQTPSDKTAAYSADQGLTFEQQKEIAELRAKAAKNGDDLEVSVIQQPGGPATVTYKGSPDVLMRNGIDPNTGEKVRPNADAQGGGASATTATKKTLEKAQPVADAAAIAKQVYPGIQITEQRRDPKSKLGRANPSSYHNHTNAAIDVRPIKGMAFEDYVNGYKQRGYHIIEAIDEVNHPSKHATGPHWHVVLGDRQPSQQLYATRLASNPNVQSAVPLDNGTVLVTTKSGKQLVYKNGVRIGG